MAADITVTPSGSDTYEVRVAEGRSMTSHQVRVSTDDATRLAPGTDPVDLVAESFRFLLEREPKESILSRFDLPVISRYFPEYAAEIGRRLPPP